MTWKIDKKFWDQKDLPPLLEKFPPFFKSDSSPYPFQYLRWRYNDHLTVIIMRGSGRWCQHKDSCHLPNLSTSSSPLPGIASETNGYLGGWYPFLLQIFGWTISLSSSNIWVDDILFFKYLGGRYPFLLQIFGWMISYSSNIWVDDIPFFFRDLGAWMISFS